MHVATKDAIGTHFAEPATPPAEPWRGPVKKDHTDFAKEKAEQDRLGAAAPPPATPPPRPVPQTIEEARAVVGRLTAEPTPVDPQVVAARAAGTWRSLKNATDVPGDRIGVGKKLYQVIAGDLDLVAGVLMEQIIAERLARRQLQETVRDLLDVVTVLVANATPPKA